MTESDNESARSTKRTKRCAENESVQDDSIEISYVEFYSGVGGWTMALEEALSRLPPEARGRKRRLRRIAALDHSDLCTRVFEHNFGTDKKAFQIERLSLKQVEEWRATVWALSPPCQPHTRQHLNQAEDLNDPRSASFLHLCDLLEKMREDCLPSLLVLENVVGFESSNSFLRWRKVLATRQYRVGHFHLTPTQVGLPNDRPRYFCVAIQREAITDSIEPQPLLSYLQSEDEICSKPPRFATAIHELDVKPQDEDPNIRPISSFLDGKKDDSLQVADKVLQGNSAWCFDIVTPSDQRSSCFTHSYGRYIKGTGSILYEESNNQFRLVAPEKREFQKDWTKDLDPSKLRYFSGTEMARLMGFSDNFSFPLNCKNKQQWKLIGNSLNVRMASRIVELGLRTTKRGEKSPLDGSERKQS
jgi:tRNA (cytosine38-C5)-methyltransferase